MTVALAVVVAGALIAGAVLIVFRRRPQPSPDWQSSDQVSADLRRAVADLTKAARQASETADRLDIVERRSTDP